MNWLDALILLPILIGLIRGLMHGFVSEVIALVVVIFGALGARFIAPPFSGALQSAFHWPAGTCDVIAYILIFIALAVIFTLIGRQLNRFLRAIHLAWLNSLVGGAFGALKAFLIVVIVVFIFERTNDEYHYLDEAPIIKESALYPGFQKAAHDLFTFSGKQSGQS